MDHMHSEKGVAEVEKRPKRALEGVWAVEVGGKQQIWPSIKEKEEKKGGGGVNGSVSFIGLFFGPSPSSPCVLWVFLF